MMNLKDSIEINCIPEKIWIFFTNLEQNYKAWHPQDHIVFKWTKGKPMESGSCWYAEEIVRGKLFKLKGTIGEVVPNRKIVFKYSFPISLVAPKFEWLIEPKGSNSVFTAISYLRAGKFLRRVFKKEMEIKIAMHNKHVKEEGENLKKILEKKTN
ncbi:MAG: SRPBCC family protein [bacterium]|nr:MAG: SRPBCC family protein [bacterium]